MKKKKALIGCAAVLVSFVASAAPAQADEGMHLGQLGQSCTAGYGFSSLGQGIRTIVAETGSFAGGVPMGLATYC